MCPEPDPKHHDKAPKSVDLPHDDGSVAGAGLGWRRLLPKTAALDKAASATSALQGPPQYSATLIKPSKPNKPPAKVSLRTSISELLLVSKLRARSLMGRSNAASAASLDNRHSPDDEKARVLACFAKILAVTCRHWFPDDQSRHASHQRRL